MTALSYIAIFMGKLLGSFTRRTDRREFRRGRFWPQFTPEMETQYRNELRQSMRAGRTGIFLLFALLFSLGASQQIELFPAPAELHPLILFVKRNLLVPLLLVAACVSYFHRIYRPLAQGIQSAALFAALGMLLVQRYFALDGGFSYPVLLTALALITVAFVGGFSWYRFAPFTAVVTAIAMALEFWQGTADSAPLRQAFFLALAGIIALLGAYNQEALSRWRWWDMMRLSKARADLRESEERFLAFMDYSPSMSWIKDADGRYVYINSSYQGFLGPAALQWYGRTDHDFFPADFADASTRIDRQVSHSGLAHAALEPVPVGTGTGKHWQVVRFPSLDSHGNRYIGGVAMDVTRLRLAEEAAMSAVRAKSEFLANMSHEIRTPLNAIVGLTGILLDSPQSPQQQEWTGIIRSSSEHLLGIVTEILDFSKIEAGRVELDSHSFALRDCIETALDLVGTGASAKNLEIAYFLHDGVPERINGDSARLRQILLNLLSNAVKFSNDGGEVGIEVKVIAADDLHGLEFSVSDGGVGIQPHQLSRLFEPFAQAEAATTRLYGGTGLGLTISKRLVELMGGSIWCESQPGRGSVFRFTVAVPMGSAPGLPNQTAAVPGLQGRSLLVVSDSAMHRRILSQQIGSWGMTLRFAADADGAAALARQDCDVALIDQRRAPDAGQEIAGRLRSLNPELPVILFGTATAALADHAAVSAFLTWPIKPQRLLDALCTLLSPHEAPSPGMPASGRATPLAQQHPLRVLIVEDNPTNQYVARLMLSRMGYQADVVTNGLEAVASVQRRTYDVVFMDIHMPVMDGAAATREIRRICRPGEAPRIIGITADPMCGDAGRGELAGMDGCILKPITPAAMAGALRSTRRLVLESKATTPSDPTG